MESIVYFEDGVVVGQYGFINVRWVYEPCDNEYVLVFDIISSDEENVTFSNVTWSDEFYRYFRRLVRSKPEEIIQKYYKGIDKKLFRMILSKVAEPVQYCF